MNNPNGILTGRAAGMLLATIVLAGCGGQGGLSAKHSTQIYVSTDPDGASLFCDAKPCGTTPATIAPVPPGEHLLIIRKSGFRETRVTAVTKPGERIAVERNLEPLKGLVLVHSVPSGAEVEMDGASIGKTPLLLHDFPLGQKRLQVSLHGCMPKSMDVNVEDRTPVKVEVPLLSDSAELVIQSTPAGATVSLDGSDAGKTPLKLENVKTGKHILEISLRGYSPSRHEFALNAGEQQKISPVLKSLPGKLTVISTPPQTRIYLNNQFKAETPFTATNIPSKRHIIHAELKGYDPQTCTNEVVSGEETTVEFNMVKSSGTMLISTMPPGIDVYMDGELRGTTKARGNEQISEKMIIDFVPKGQHRLLFIKKDYYDVQRVVDINPKQTVSLHEKMRFRPVPFVPDVIIRNGDGPEHTFRGIVREKFANGDVKAEIEPGIFKTFSKAEIVSMEPIAPAGR